MTFQYLLQSRHASECGFSRGVAIIGIVKGKWFALSASITLLALVGIAVAMLSRVSAKKTKPAAAVTQAAPQAEIQLSGKIRAQSVINVAPPVEGTVGALFADVGQEAHAMGTLGDPRRAPVSGRGAASGALAAAVAVAQEEGATISAALLVDGEPANALLTAAKERAADLVVVGALRDTSIADRLLGTVATDVVRRAECEVLVVRPRRDATELPPVSEEAST